MARRKGKPVKKKTLYIIEELSVHLERLSDESGSSESKIANVALALLFRQPGETIKEVLRLLKEPSDAPATK